LSSPSLYELEAGLCRALGHPVRLELIYLLREGPKRVADLAQMTGLNQGTVSRHLVILRNSGILTAHQHGRDNIYSLADPRIFDLCDLMRQVLLDQSAKHSKMLKAFGEMRE
jgi:DNA-binding transcriptional ArsR family regulator